MDTVSQVFIDTLPGGSWPSRDVPEMDTVSQVSVDTLPGGSLGPGHPRMFLRWTRYPSRYFASGSLHPEVFLDGHSIP